jgi:hypothetical protein
MYEVRRHTTVHEDLCRRSSNNVFLQKCERLYKLVLPVGGIYEVLRWSELRWHDMSTKLYDDPLQAFKKHYCYYHSNLEGCNMGITDRRDLSCTPLSRFHVAWYAYEVSWILVEAFKKIERFASEIWKDVILVLLVGGIYKVRNSTRLRQHDIFIKSHDYRFRHLTNITVITAKVWGAVKLVLLIERNYEMRHWDSFIWHGMLPSFMKTGIGVQAMLRFCLRNLRGCN